MSMTRPVASARVTEQDVTIRAGNVTYEVLAVGEPREDFDTGDTYYPVMLARPRGRKEYYARLMGFRTMGEAGEFPILDLQKKALPGITTRALDKEVSKRDAVKPWLDARRRMMLASAPHGGRCAICHYNADCRKIYGDDYPRMAAEAQDGCSQFTPTIDTEEY